MATFSSSSSSFQHHPLFLADSSFNPDLSAIKMDATLDEFMPNLRHFYTSSGNSELGPVVQTQEGCSVDASAHESSCVEQQSVQNGVCLTDKQRNNVSLSSMVDKAESGEQVTQNWVPSDKKRKARKGSSSNFVNSKDAKCKKQKADKGVKNDVKNGKNDQNKGNEEPPKGFIHVRARRGQATDSHSLAERVRREKISERMRTLQALVPGCDKVTGKALMLDEIISYVQSLQNQVEFLSMKLASLDPMVYHFGIMDLDAMLFGNEVDQGVNNTMAIPSQLPQLPSNSVPISSSQQQQDFTNANACFTGSTTCSTTCTTFPTHIDTPTPLAQHDDDKPNFHTSQDVGGSYWGVNEQLRQSLINQFGFSANNLYSLQ